MNNSADYDLPDRRNEWFVPDFGPLKFRTFIGLLFLPYTGMVISFSLIGSLLSEHLSFERMFAILIIYFLGLGVAAHALDALGSKGIKPWGNVFSKKQLLFIALLSLFLAYIISIYYMIRYVPLLLIVAILEGFFVFAYNLEWFEGKFHSDWWFAFSWGGLPVLAGFIMQTNRISFPSILTAISMLLLSLVEIKVSRPYKEIKRRWPYITGDEELLLQRFEFILKALSMGIIILGAGLFFWRIR